MIATACVNQSKAAVPSRALLVAEQNGLCLTGKLIIRHLTVWTFGTSAIEAGEGRAARSCLRCLLFCHTSTVSYSSPSPLFCCFPVCVAPLLFALLVYRLIHFF